MHPKVELALRELWEKRGRPKSGHAFLNRLGKPYADTRDYKIQGGNPLKKAHATALRLRFGHDEVLLDVTLRGANSRGGEINAGVVR